MHRAFSPLSILVWLVFVSAVAGEEVEVIVDSTPIKVEDSVVASAQRSDRYRVIRRSGPWIAVSCPTEGGMSRGWVFAGHVQTVIPPGIDEASPCRGIRSACSACSEHAAGVPRTARDLLRADHCQRQS